jgi:hemolysin D
MNDNKPSFSLTNATEREAWHEFHPTALMIERQPTSPFGRMIFWVLLLLLVVLVCVLYFGETDVTVPGRGQVISSSAVQVIQPLEGGILERIHVKVGDHVEKGDVLFELAPELLEASTEANTAKGASFSLEAQRLQALISGTGFSPSCGSAACPPDLVANEMQQYNNAKQAFQSRLNGLASQLDGLRQRQQTLALQQQNANQQLSLVNTELARLKPVEDLIAKNEITNLEQQKNKYQGDITRLSSESLEISHQLQTVSQQEQEYRNQFKNELSNQLMTAKREIITVEAVDAQSEFQKERQQLRAPRNGTITELNVDTEGSVIGPSQILAKLVDNSEGLQAKLLISNRDIGQLKQGQPVKIKVDAFDYQKYGMMYGKLAYLGTNQLSSEQTNKPEDEQALPFNAIVDFDKETIKVDGVERPLDPGMSVSGEVMIGRRKLYEFFLYPLLKASREAFTLR